jgi:hypothetical protein
LQVSSNHRKGGLVALASACVPPRRGAARALAGRSCRVHPPSPALLPCHSAIGLAGATADYLDVLVPAVLRSFGDQDARVRYYACEVGGAAARAAPAWRRRAAGGACAPTPRARARRPSSPPILSCLLPVAVQHCQGRARRRAALLRRHFRGRVRAGGGL